MVKIDKQRIVQTLYTSGMDFAQALRRLQRHEEAHEMELYVLALRQEITNQVLEETDKASDISEANHD